MLSRRLTELEFNRAYGVLFDQTGSARERLGWVRSLDQNALKKAYRRRAQETHPDRAHLRVGFLPTDPDAEFRSVVSAYELLKLVQQGSVDVVLIPETPPISQGMRSARQRPATDLRRGQPTRARAQTRATSSSAGFETSRPQPQRQAQKPPYSQPGSTKNTERQHAESATAGSADHSARGDRAGKRTDWSEFWRHTASASRFSPHSDHYNTRPLPSGALLFGQYLYYTGVVTWRQLIDALVWQRQHRPLIGQIARSWGMLTETQVQEILAARRSSGRLDARFAEYALEMGFLSNYDKMALCGRLRSMQRPLGQYFVTQGIFTDQDMRRHLMDNWRHNWRAQNARKESGR